jgi:hypothetical protein
VRLLTARFSSLSSYFYCRQLLLALVKFLFLSVGAYKCLDNGNNIAHQLQVALINSLKLNFIKLKMESTKFFFFPPSGQQSSYYVASMYKQSRQFLNEITTVRYRFSKWTQQEIKSNLVNRTSTNTCCTQNYVQVGIGT